MELLKLQPVFKDYIWGGTRLKTEFNKSTDLNKVAESWELACHKDNKSIITNGEFARCTLESYIEAKGKSALGTNCERFEQFPVLIKLIDAKDDLSIQVHPDNEYALKAEGEYGKTEMWYIVDCEQGASLLYGFKHSISKAEFRDRIQNNTLLEVLNRVPVKKGDVFFIEAGTLHAIGKGIIIAEIQQNSNTTYRVYDYGRLSADGKPRELHIQKALDVTKLEPAAQSNAVKVCEKSEGFEKAMLSECEYFKVYKITSEKSCTLNAGEDSFNSLLCVEGGAVVKSGECEIEMRRGDCVFIPAGAADYTINGGCEMLLTCV